MRQRLRQNAGIIISFTGLMVFAVGLSINLMRRVPTTLAAQRIAGGDHSSVLLILGLALMISGLLIRVWQAVLPLLRHAAAKRAAQARKSGL